MIEKKQHDSIMSATWYKYMYLSNMTEKLETKDSNVTEKSATWKKYVSYQKATWWIYVNNMTKTSLREKYVHIKSQ